MSRVVGFGELMLRLSPPGQERLFQSPQLRTWFGGSEANVIAGLSHLGARTEYVTRLPQHAVGDAALRALRAEGVGTHHVLRGGARLGTYFVESGADVRDMQVVYDRAGSAFSEIAGDAVDWANILRSASWLHLSGITPALGDGPAQAMAAAVHATRATGTSISFDLNYRAALWAGRDPKPVIRPLLTGCDLLVGNPFAVRQMLGIAVDDAPGASPGSYDESRLRRLATRVAEDVGCRWVALTHREVLSASEHGWSAALLDAESGAFHASRRWQVRVVDRVGGGDSFVAGLLYALLERRAADAALDFATAASALKLTIPGDFNRVSVAEVERLLQQPV
jgi:2-dehydro-3-deoxygluconokinase